MNQNKFQILLMFKKFQTYLIRITTDLVQILQANKPLSTDNVVSLSQVYDGGKKLVVWSNTSLVISHNLKKYRINRQSSFSGYPYPFQIYQIITQLSQYPPYNMVHVLAHIHPQPMQQYSSQLNY